MISEISEEEKPFQINGIELHTKNWMFGQLTKNPENVGTMISTR